MPLSERRTSSIPANYRSSGSSQKVSLQHCHLGTALHIVICVAATQRNLSPEDTDLIELTLTTICALDKLLHLLRDRSDNLDLLGIRLIWEELRAAAWTERRNII